MLVLWEFHFLSAFLIFYIVKSNNSWRFRDTMLLIDPIRWFPHRSLCFYFYSENRDSDDLERTVLKASSSKHGYRNTESAFVSLLYFSSLWPRGSARAFLKSKRDLESLHRMEWLFSLFFSSFLIMHSPLFLSLSLSLSLFFSLPGMPGRGGGSLLSRRSRREVTIAARWHCSFLFQRCLYDLPSEEPEFLACSSPDLAKSNCKEWSRLLLAPGCVSWLQVPLRVSSDFIMLTASVYE